MKNKLLKKSLNSFTALAFWIFIWEALSRIINDNLKLFLPGPIKVLKAFILLFPTCDFWKACGATLIRIFCGLVFGCLFGIVLGIATEEIPILDIIISPILKIIRAVPVVSFIILAYLFINIKYLPVFISMLMVIPLVWQNVHDGLKNTDIKMIEMSRVYKISKGKTLLFIKLPLCTDQIISSLINAVGLSWKSGIATEVLCTPIVSIGKNIYRAKANLNFDQVYALTLTVVILSLVFEIALKNIWKSQRKQEVKNND